MDRRQPVSNRHDTRLPYTALCRSAARFQIRCSFPLDPHCLSGAAMYKAPMAGCPAIESPFIVRSWPLNAPPVWSGRPVAASDVWPDVAEGAGPAGLEQIGRAHV